MKRINSVIAIVLLMALAAGCSNVRNSKAEMTSGSDTAIGKTTAAETTAAATTTSETTVDTTIVFSMDAKDETETTTAETTVKKKPKEPVIKFSGKAKDVFTLKADSYYEGDKFVIFAQKGAKLRGDVPKNISKIMGDLEKLFNMSYKKTEFTFEDDWRDIYFGGSFQGINSDLSKVSIIIFSLLSSCYVFFTCCYLKF